MILDAPDAGYVLHDFRGRRLVVVGRHRARQPHDALARLHMDIGRLHVPRAEQVGLHLGRDRAVTDMLADRFRAGGLS